VDSDGPKELCIRWGPDPSTGRALFRGDDVRILLHATKQVPSGPDTGIFPHADRPLKAFVRLKCFYMDHTKPCTFRSGIKKT